MWCGATCTCSEVEHVQLINVELSKAVNGLEFTNVSAAVVEANGLHISDSFNDGIRLINSDLLELDYAKVTDSGRHGVWSDGGYVDAFNHIHLLDNGYSGVWMETAGDITGSLNLVIGHGQNGFTTQGMSHLQITGSDIFDIGHKNAFAAGSSTLLVPNNWWGEPNPDPSMFEELAGATLNYSNPSSTPNLPRQIRKNVLASKAKG